MKGNTSLWAAKETVNRFQAHDCWAVNSWLTGALLTAHGLTFLGHEHRELILLEIESRMNAEPRDRN